MNTRIKELLDQCINKDMADKPWPLVDTDKFAKLIVKECAAMTRNLCPHGEFAEKAVKEYFGVE